MIFQTRHEKNCKDMAKTRSSPGGIKNYLFCWPRGAFSSPGGPLAAPKADQEGLQKVTFSTFSVLGVFVEFVVLLGRQHDLGAWGPHFVILGIFFKRVFCSRFSPALVFELFFSHRFLL